MLFCAISMLLAWGVALPLWFGAGILDPRLGLIASIMMFTPTIAVLVVAMFEGRVKTFIRDVGIWPVRRPVRFLVAMVLAYLIPLALIIQAPYVGTWLGVFPGDLEHFTVLHFIAGADGPAKYLLGQAGLIAIAGLVNTFFAMGEEIGWRGWLWIRLQKYGTVPAILLSGVIWGLWHAPLILLGYNYPFARGAWGLAAMCGLCIILGAFLGWIRSFSDSVWPAALAHGVFNASAGLVAIFMAMGASLDATEASIMGWSGWIIPGVVIVIMISCGAFKRSIGPALSTVR